MEQPSTATPRRVTAAQGLVCDTCGSRYADSALAFCPNCGGILMKETPARLHGLWRRWDWLRLLGMAVIATLLALGALAAAAALGLRAGASEREQRIHTIADQHFAKGQGYLSRREYDIALAEFEYVLQIEPGYPGAADAIAQAKSALQSAPSPTSQVQGQAAAAAFAAGKAAYDVGHWEDAIAALRQVQSLDPDYELQAVQDMLYTAYRSQGLALLTGDQLERAASYLEQAAAIRPLDAAAETQRERAALYLTAQRYWGVDWNRAIELFQELYSQSPDYRDVAARLLEARIIYGNLLAGKTEWCPAEAQYAAAIRLAYSAEVERKRVAASRACQTATPTPLGGGITATATLSTPAPIAGFNAGKLAFAAYDPATGDSSLYMVSASDLHRQRVAVAADQPAWRHDGGRLAYRQHGDRPGLYIAAPDGTGATQIVSGTISQPTWSPDGNRLAYAALDASGEWTIYIVNADGSGTPKPLAKGRWPAWGPNGSLAFAGCDRSDLLCGIYSDSNPDDPRPPVRLTSDPNDIGLTWSPDGMNIAYMSNHTGNWEVYIVNVWGGVTLLTNDPANDGLPAWAPDGSALAFISDRDGTWGIYLMRPDGSQQRKLVELGPVYPDWLNQRLAWAP